MQTTYNGEMAIGLEGQLADLGLKDAITVIGEVAIPFGRAVVKGAKDDTGKLPESAANVTDEKIVKGVSLHTHAVHTNCPPLSGYPQGAAVGVLRKGRVIVVAQDAVTVGTSTVNVRVSGEGDVGTFYGAAQGADTAVLPRAKWVRSAGAGELAILEIDL